MTTLRKIEIVKLPILTKALVVLLAASCVQERLIIEVCAQEYWDFEYGYKHVDQDNAEDYLFETSNTRIYSEWHDPPVTYWGPSANDVVGTITYKFEFDRPTEKIHLKASIASFNFPQPGNEYADHHLKEGIFYFEDGTIAFGGSANESVRGWSKNLEVVDVYRSWIETDIERIENKQNRFDNSVACFNFMAIWFAFFCEGGVSRSHEFRS